MMRSGESMVEKPHTEVPHAFIAVEGPIGVGKTSLARRLADSLRAELILENAEENPFLPRFYRDPRNAALPAQLFFLFQRVEQVRGLHQPDLFQGRQVSDFLLDKDRLFAEVVLDEHEFRLYEQIYDTLAPRALAPDLVIYLQAPVKVLQARIAKRAIGYEQSISREYLARLNEAYMSFFHHYDRSPLLIVNAAEINLAEGEAEYRLLLEQISRVKSGRHYFNPARDLL